MNGVSAQNDEAAWCAASTTAQAYPKAAQAAEACAKAYLIANGRDLIYGATSGVDRQIRRALTA
jgi:hypothetical protein